MGQAVIWLIQFLCDYFREKRPGTNKHPPCYTFSLCGPISFLLLLLIYWAFVKAYWQIPHLHILLWHLHTSTNVTFIILSHGLHLYHSPTSIAYTWLRVSHWVCKFLYQIPHMNTYMVFTCVRLPYFTNTMTCSSVHFLANNRNGDRKYISLRMWSTLGHI